MPSISTYFTLLYIVSVLITNLSHIHTFMYIVLGNTYTLLSTFLNPFLDGLLGHDPCSVEGGIKADLLVVDNPGAWLLQYPSWRYLDAVTDQFDCLGLSLGVLVSRVQLDAILVSEISSSTLQVFAKI